MIFLRLLPPIALLAALASPAAAQPSYYQVTGVAEVDVLNIRVEPDANSEVMGTLAPGAAPVEVLEAVIKSSVAWGRVIGADADGWVSMRFLVPIEVEKIGETIIPQGLTCFGTEPFWSVRIDSVKGIDFSTADGQEGHYALESAIAAVARNDHFALIGVDGKGRMTMMLARDAECSDGMSDRDYPWRVDILRELPGSPDYPHSFEGCCRLPVSGKD